MSMIISSLAKNGLLWTIGSRSLMIMANRQYVMYFVPNFSDIKYTSKEPKNNRVFIKTISVPNLLIKSTLSAGHVIIMINLQIKTGVSNTLIVFKM